MEEASDLRGYSTLRDRPDSTRVSAAFTFACDGPGRAATVARVMERVAARGAQWSASTARYLSCAAFRSKV